MKDNIETKSVPWECKVDTGKRTFEGYAATFGNIDATNDRLHPGAFRKTLQERGKKIKVLWQHNPADPIGKAFGIAEDSKGLHVEAQVVKGEKYDSYLELMDAGVVDSMSIGFKTIRSDFERVQDIEVRNLYEVKLFEFSPVTFPANEAAQITAVTKDLFGKQVSLDQLSDLLEELKAGRMLSAKNITIIRNAVEATKNAATVLDALLAAAKTTEPEKSTRPDHSPREPQESKRDPERLQSLLESLRKTVAELK